MEGVEPKPATELESFTERARHLHEHLFGKRVVMIDETESAATEPEETPTEADR